MLKSLIEIKEETTMNIIHSRPFQILFLNFLFLAVFLTTCYSQGERPIILKGTIVTPGEIIQGGYVVIENQKISSIIKSLKEIDAPVNAIHVDTKGIIFPGLVDVHNHVPFNVFPEWHPGKNKFSNRYQWRYHSAEHQKTVKQPSDNMEGFRCQMNTYGEIRALVGGTTSILNTSADKQCVQGLVRNLDDPSQVDLRTIEYLIDIQNFNPAKSDVEVQQKLDAVKARLTAGTVDAVFIHLAEGKASDSISKGEFKLLQDNALLTDKTAIIHGVAFGLNEFRAMHNAGASLVWSPKSNLELYGQTADIKTAKQQGVKIALAPDWSITGSNNLLGELNYAASWNREHLNGLFSDKELVDMATTTPASIAGLSDKIGAIKVGLYADLLVISGNVLQPHTSLVQAKTNNVKLVLVNGVPLYGAQELMEKFWNKNQLEVLLNSASPMALKLPLPNSMKSFSELQKNLSSKLTAEGTSLAPLFMLRKSTNKPTVGLENVH